MGGEKEKKNETKSKNKLRRRFLKEGKNGEEARQGVVSVFLGTNNNIIASFSARKTFFLLDGSAGGNLVYSSQESKIELLFCEKNVDEKLDLPLLAVLQGRRHLPGKLESISRSG